MPATSTHAFAEKVALVTAAGDPVGRAIALQLALSGAFVIVADGDSSGRALLDELTSLGTLAAFAEGEAFDSETAAQIIGVAAAMFGRLDLLVNCARQKASGDVFDASFADPVRATHLILEAATPLMSERPKPRIVNVFRDSSPANPDPLQAAAAAAIGSLTESWAKSLPSKFRVNGVGIIESGLADEIDEDTLLRRPGGVSPDDAARAAMFLLSGEAVAVNGRIIRVE